MDASHDLSTIGRGLANTVMDSQRVFRQCLHALSRPGHMLQIYSDAEAPAGVGIAACAILLALPDHDTRVWLSPSFGVDASAYFRFHTGCPITNNSYDADFALIRAIGELPLLPSFKHGSDEYPDHSAFVIVEVPSIATDHGLRLTGPGILNEARLSIPGVDHEFLTQWMMSRKLFPRGVDIIFTCGAMACSLPRSIQLSEN
jgi:alpha-D-ribose 1-methylphosphonate 5-triphosphate synthase subunit PhnH